MAAKVGQFPRCQRRSATVGSRQRKRGTLLLQRVQLPSSHMPLFPAALTSNTLGISKGAVAATQNVWQREMA